MHASLLLLPPITMGPGGKKSQFPPPHVLWHAKTIFICLLTFVHRNYLIMNVIVIWNGRKRNLERASPLTVV